MCLISVYILVILVMRGYKSLKFKYMLKFKISLLSFVCEESMIIIFFIVIDFVVVRKYWVCRYYSLFDDINSFCGFVM